MDMSPSTSSSSRRGSTRNAGKEDSIIDDLDETTEIESEAGDDEERDEFEEGDGAQMDGDVDGELDAADDTEDGVKKGGGKKSEDVFEDFEFVPRDSEVASSLSEEVTIDAGGWGDGDKVCSAVIKKDRKFVCIDYPGVIRNVDKAVATLGGLQDLTEALSQNHRLNLVFRPNDPYCKGAMSTLNLAKNLLVKLRRRRKHPAAMETGSADEYEYQVEVIGIVEKVHVFEKMCDFQYLPVIKHPDGQYKEILSSIRPTIEDERDEYLSRNIPLFLPPYCFSRREKPCGFFFESEPFQEGDTSFVQDRKKRFHGVVHVSHHNPTVPLVPDPDAFQNLSKLPVSNVEDGRKSLDKIFEERPLWTKAGILSRLDPYHHRYIKFLLPVVAFYFDTGPWRNLWCKFGYDPRKNPESKKYQTLDFRLRSVASRNQVDSKRGFERYSHPQLKIRKNTLLHGIEEDEEEIEKKEENKNLDLNYVFSPAHRPPYRQMRYQVCDVMLDDVQKKLHENDGQESVCTERDGWCVADFTDVCRDIMHGACEKLFK
ncbi:general transcription factor 3C polypeptide 5-like isoform X2 [Physella acuta]|uniref:general transcription factor 3C polypeptide 5-like isoform X2 n=1 Tax=Physella acuta TaxID=109671 RepID=UPI0027DEA378|nr:general transcription factor 3C polypeptide 5-like isoform X2 [Physella acuta]